MPTTRMFLRCPWKVRVVSMGHHIRLLAEKEIDQKLYYDHRCTLELRECIHDHLEDLRPVYTREEFLQMAEHWARAKAEFDRLGQPEPSEQNISLDTLFLDGERLHHSRAAVELAVGGADKDGGGDTIHFHYRHCRTHLTKLDFYRIATMFKEALASYNEYACTVVRLSDPNVRIRDVARDMLVPWLEGYKAGDYPAEDPDSYWKMFLEARELLRPEEIQRPDGGWLVDRPKTRVLPEEFDKRYLFTLFECMKKYGYGEGMFEYDYVPAMRLEDGRIELMGSHRAACLVCLGYDEVKVSMIN